MGSGSVAPGQQKLRGDLDLLARVHASRWAIVTYGTTALHGVLAVLSGRQSQLCLSPP